jgi:LysM repeat protein
MNNIYNDMFAVSSIKAKNKLGNGSVQQLTNTTKGTYDLENRNVYDEKTGELVKEGTQIEYNSQFLISLKRLYILEIKPFLNHHLTNSNNKVEFFDYVKYAALNSEIIKHQGQKQAIKDWVNDNEQLFKVNPISKSEKHLKELHTHIFKGNAFEIWQTMFDSFQITESSRTNVKFMFEEMKKDNLIHNTVNQKTFLNWISETYQITVEKTSNYSKTIERKSIYSNAKQRCKVQGT